MSMILSNYMIILVSILSVSTTFWAWDGIHNMISVNRFSVKLIIFHYNLRVKKCLIILIMDTNGLGKFCFH